MQSREKSNKCNHRDYASSRADRLRKHMANMVADKKQKKMAGMNLDMVTDMEVEKMANKVAEMVHGVYWAEAV